jgi:serine/threonine protein kinase
MAVETLPLKIGKYKISGLLGKGSMGVVYKARDPEIGRIVAIKILKSQLKSVNMHSALNKFRTEAIAVGNLRHQNIVTLFEVNMDGEHPYIVMDFIEGVRLDTFIKDTRVVKIEELLYYFSQVVSGLDYAHEHGVVHCDIKPSNIIIDKKFHVYILDFGVANIIGASDIQNGGLYTEKKSSQVFGTPAYMSPEQILNETLDGRTDIFSLGVVIFESLTGIRPFAGEDFTTVISNILEGNRLKLYDVNPKLPKALDEVFERALSRRREERYESGEKFIEALARSVATEIPSKPPKSDEFNTLLFQEDVPSITKNKFIPFHLNSIYIVAAVLALSISASLWLISNQTPRLVDENLLDKTALSFNNAQILFLEGGFKAEKAEQASESSQTENDFKILKKGVQSFTNPDLEKISSYDELTVRKELDASILSLSENKNNGASRKQGAGVSSTAAVSEKHEEFELIKITLILRRIRVIFKYSKYPEDIVEKICLLLKHYNYTIRSEAIIALTGNKNGYSEEFMSPLLEAMLLDRFPEVRMLAAEYLGKYGYKSSLRSLKFALLKENIQTVKNTIHTAIVKIG